MCQKIHIKQNDFRCKISQFKPLGKITHNYIYRLTTAIENKRVILCKFFQHVQPLWQVAASKGKTTKFKTFNYETPNFTSFVSSATCIEHLM